MDEGATLVGLMENDLARARATKALEELPEKRAILQLRARLAEIVQGLAKATAYVAEIDRTIARLSDEITVIDERMHADQHRLTSGEITNPKELQSFSRELDSLRRKKERTEDEMLKLMEKRETGVTTVEKIEGTLTQGAAKEAELISAFQKRGGALQTEIAKATATRDALLASLPPQTKSAYERAREHKHGIAVGVLTGAICSACRVELPAEHVQSLVAGPPVAQCPTCRRILVVRTGDTA